MRHTTRPLKLCDKRRVGVCVCQETAGLMEKGEGGKWIHPQHQHLGPEGAGGLFSLGPHTIIPPRRAEALTLCPLLASTRRKATALLSLLPQTDVSEAHLCRTFLALGKRQFV